MKKKALLLSVICMLACSGLVSCSTTPDLVIPETVTNVAAKSTFKKARENDIASIRTIASYYERGVYGFPQSNRQAANWYQRGAELGDVECQYRIGLAYFEKRGRWPDADEAGRWLRRAAAQGHAGAKRIVHHPTKTVEEQMFPR
ncbi:MAG: sel1 repeat family protein [Akkermansia sp.]|nr:sel1 repeat family protein [Akkermansia sp.]